MELKQLAQVAKELGLENDPDFINIFRRLNTRWNQKIYEKLVESLIRYSSKPLIDTTFPVPFKDEDLIALDGPYKIGRIAETDIDFGITPQQLNYHAVIGGQSGFGKTTLIKILVQEILKEGRTVIWIFDPKGKSVDFTFLAGLFDVIFLLYFCTFCGCCEFCC